MTSHATYDAASALLPAGAEWSSSFGNPGEGGYTEFWRTGNVRHKITNGNYEARQPFQWDITPEPTAASAPGA